MPVIVDGNIGLTFPDTTSQNTSAVIAGRTPVAKLPAGTVIQTVSATMPDGIFSTTSGSWVDTGFSASITPTSATSKIVILFNSGGITRSGVVSECARLQIVRGASTVVYGGQNLYYTTSNISFSDWPSSMQCIDSPATTSSTTYKIQMQTRLNNSCSMNTGSGGQNATLILMEIAQ